MAYQAYLVNCDRRKVEKSLNDKDGVVLLYLDYDQAKLKMEDTNQELGGEFFQVVEVSVEVI